jgi:tRNA(fMet)-specific endonuclease VapC
LESLRKRVQRLREIIADDVEYTCEDAVYYGAIRAHLARLKPNAQPIGPYDLMLAAQALRLGAVVVTHNVVEFRRVPGLVVEDWQGQT